MKAKAFTPLIIASLFTTTLVRHQSGTVLRAQEPTRQTQSAEAQQPYLGKFATYEDAAEFLRTAQITQSKKLSAGITASQRLTLEKDGRQEHGIFKTIDMHEPGITPLRTGPELDFKDSWKYEVAAYEVDKLLGLKMVPPTVERFHDDKKGSLQLWIDGCITEDDRVKKNLNPPDPTNWGEQILKQRVFDNLIFDIDRNAGNILITANWRMLLVDHSRTFKISGDLKAAKDLTYFSRSLMEALGKLNEQSVRQQTEKYLTGYEIRSMLQRRDKILALYRKVADNPGAVYP